MALQLSAHSAVTGLRSSSSPFPDPATRHSSILTLEAEPFGRGAHGQIATEQNLQRLCCILSTCSGPSQGLHKYLQAHARCWFSFYSPTSRPIFFFFLMRIKNPFFPLKSNLPCLMQLTVKGTSSPLIIPGSRF